MNFLAIVFGWTQNLKPVQQLQLTLRFYITGSFYITLEEFMGVLVIAGCAIKRTTQAILTLRNKYIRCPNSEEEENEIQETFFKMPVFRTSSINCTHMKIQSPGNW